MATQRVYLFAIGGQFADIIWKDIRRWSDARGVASTEEWSSDDWPAEIRDEIDAFVHKIVASAFTPPVLYRSEHVDCWSMGDVYHDAIVKPHLDYSRQLYTTKHEVIATRVHFTEQIVLDEGAPDETKWLYNRVNEAIGAWGEFAEDRLILLIRTFLGALWADDEVRSSLRTVPAWWTETEQSDQPEPE